MQIIFALGERIIVPAGAGTIICSGRRLCRQWCGAIVLPNRSLLALSTEVTMSFICLAKPQRDNPIENKGRYSSAVNLSSKISWFTTSKALEKSTSKQRTYILVSSIRVTRCIKLAKPHVVLPAGLNANWSAIYFRVTKLRVFISWSRILPPSFKFLQFIFLIEALRFIPP